MKKRVFIQTNDRQLVGARVSAYSLKRNSQHTDDFEIEIMHREDTPSSTPTRGGSSCAPE